MIGASATGPLLLSLGNDVYASYAPVLLHCAGVTFGASAVTATIGPPRAVDGG